MLFPHLEMKEKMDIYNITARVYFIAVQLKKVFEQSVKQE